MQSDLLGDTDKALTTCVTMINVSQLSDESSAIDCP